jgi:hypothetical protein
LGKRIGTHLNRAAALARVEESAVDELCCGVIEIGVGGDVRRVFPTKLRGIE